MLKSENSALLIVLLLADASWEEPVSYILAVFGALIIRNGFEWDNGTFTRKSFLIRMMYTIGGSIAIFLFVNKDTVVFGWRLNRALILFINTLISDFIVKRGIKFLIYANNKFFEKQQSKIE